jgi:hypothetical protein
MGLHDHPGYFGITSQGVIAIHADWPIYPEEHGPGLALLWLTAFPSETVFRKIDDIDRCILLLAEPQIKPDPFDEQNYHVAIWHEDLATLSMDRFISGAESATEKSWEMNRWAKFPDPIGVIIDGKFIESPRPDFDDFDDERARWALVATEGLRVTADGRSKVADYLAEEGDLQALGDKVNTLFKMSYFDTALREACVEIEYDIKTWLGTDAFGVKLIEAFSARLTRDGYLNTFVRTLRTELRLTFRFIRNEFAHNIVELDVAAGKANLLRLARLRHLLTAIFQRDEYAI